jgi:hypothetical protein
MPTVGQLYTPTLTVAGADATTAVGLALVDPYGASTAPAVSGAPAAGDAPGWTYAAAPFAWPSAGQWRLDWRVVGPGAEGGPFGALIGVAPDPVAGNAADDGGGFTYATTADLANYSGQAPPADARRLLVNASREIDRITKSALYAVDPRTGLARDPRVRKALADATCEVIGWWDEIGDTTGARGLITSASIAGVSIGWGGQGQTTNLQKNLIGPRVWTILLDAGLVQSGSVLYE